MAAQIKTLFIVILMVGAYSGLAQKTLMLEKVGTSRHLFFHTGDHMEIRLRSNDTLLKGTLFSLTDTSLVIMGQRPYPAPLSDVDRVYRTCRHVRKIGVRLAEAGFVYSGILLFNRLINREQVFTKDMWIVPLGGLAAAGISFSFMKRRYTTGLHWKLKVLDMTILR